MFYDCITNTPSSSVRNNYSSKTKCTEEYRQGVCKGNTANPIRVAPPDSSHVYTCTNASKFNPQIADFRRISTANYKIDIICYHLEV